MNANDSEMAYRLLGYAVELGVEMVGVLASITEATIGRDPKDIQRFLNLHGLTNVDLSNQVCRKIAEMP